ncbi:MAG: hypothetical protein QXQ90_09865 [Desulfurococcaceae archaeon]
MKRVKISSCERKLFSGFITSVFEFVEHFLHLLETAAHTRSSLSSAYIAYIVCKAFYFVVAKDAGNTYSKFLHFVVAHNTGNTFRNKLIFATAFNTGSTYRNKLCFAVAFDSGSTCVRY